MKMKIPWLLLIIIQALYYIISLYILENVHHIEATAVTQWVIIKSNYFTDNLLFSYDV